MRSSGLPGDGELFERVREAGFPAERIECGPYASGRKSAADVARFFTDTPRLARQLREHGSDGADLVYINGPRLLPAASLARLAAAGGVPFAQPRRTRTDAPRGGTERCAA